MNYEDKVKTDLHYSLQEFLNLSHRAEIDEIKAFGEFLKGSLSKQEIKELREFLKENEEDFEVKVNKTPSAKDIFGNSPYSLK